MRKLFDKVAMTKGQAKPTFFNKAKKWRIIVSFTDTVYCGAEVVKEFVLRTRDTNQLKLFLTKYLGYN